MPRISVWFNEEERDDIFEMHKSESFYSDCKVTEKFINKFNRLIKVLEAMQCYLHIKEERE